MERMAPVTKTITPTTLRSRIARRWRIAVVGVSVAALGGLVGANMSVFSVASAAPAFKNVSASDMAAALGCAGYTPETAHDESAYHYRDRGACTFDRVTVTVTTFWTPAQSQAYLTLLNGIIPQTHPQWTRAATAAGDYWNIGASADLNPDVAENVVRTLANGGVEMVPLTASAK